MQQAHTESTQGGILPTCLPQYSGASLDTDELRHQLTAVAKHYSPITLDQINGAALQKRIDTKYVLSLTQLLQALTAVTPHYHILEIENNRLNHYQILYFDTPHFDLYQRHHNGFRKRHKVRSRVYVDSELAFLEVKFKANKQKTIKHRLQTSQIITEFKEDTARFLQENYPYEADKLEPKLWTNFRRITLVSKTQKERLTLDCSLIFANETQQIELIGVAIAEVKQEQLNINSDFIRQMRQMNVRPTGFSKYCLGVTHLYPHLKSNNFKAKHLLLEKLTQGGN